MVVAAPAFAQNEAMLEYSALAIAKRLSEAMKEEGISNTALAAACSVTVQAVGDWKRTGKISREKIALVAKTIRRTTDWLLTGEQNILHSVADESGPHAATTTTASPAAPEDPRKRAMLDLWDKLSPEQRDALFRLLGHETDKRAQ